MMESSSNPISTGHSALAKTNWLEAKKHLENVLKESDSPEGRDGLGLALWWLNRISEAHEQRTLAYLGYKAVGDLPKAAHLAACLAKMSEVAFSDAYDEGQKMTLDEAVLYALKG